MKVNRYTTYTPPRYTPRTLQDLMTVPMYKRQQHDLLSAGQAELETKLASADSMSEHSEYLKEKQKALYGDLENQANKLQQEGFTQGAKGDFIRFNKKYQQEVGPQGDIGKMAAIKQKFETEKAELIKNGTTMGFPPSEIQKQIDAKREEYRTKFGESGKLVDFEMPMPPAFADLQEDLLTAKTMLGSELKRILQKDGYTIDTDENGLFAIRTSKASKLTEDNKKALARAQDYLNARWSGKGKGAQAMPWLGLDKAQVAKEIEAGLGMMIQDREEDLTEIGYQFTPIPKAAASNATSGRNVNFITYQGQGLEMGVIEEGSILLVLDRMQKGLEFDSETGNIITRGVNANDGNINSVTPEFATYEDKVAFERTKLQSNEKIIFEDGMYYKIIPKIQSAMNESSPDPNYRLPIYYDPNHIVSKIDKMREENPLLEGYSDQELIAQMQAFKENLTSNYITIDTAVGADYEDTAKLLLGKGGPGIAGAEVYMTIDGTQLDIEGVQQALGYDSFKDLKEKGQPSINGYSPATGKFHVNLYDNDGNVTAAYIDAPPQLQKITKRTQEAVKALASGKQIANLGPALSKEWDGFNMFVVNDFINPPIFIMSKQQNVTKVSDLIEYEYAPYLSPNVTGRVVVKNNDNLTDEQLAKSYMGFNQLVDMEVNGILNTTTNYYEMGLRNSPMYLEMMNKLDKNRNKPE